MRTPENQVRDPGEPQPTSNGAGKNQASPAVDAAAVRAQLERILLSAPFRNSKRYPAFLRYVVEQELSGASSELKERTIAIDVFGKDPYYDPAADPVVRISAGEVRKRLAQYYQEVADPAQLRIELPVGSYRPEFVAPPRPVASVLPIPVPSPAAEQIRVDDEPPSEKEAKPGRGERFGAMCGFGRIDLGFRRQQADRAGSILASSDPADSFGDAVPGTQQFPGRGSAGRIVASDRSAPGRRGLVGCGNTCSTGGAGAIEGRFTLLFPGGSGDLQRFPAEARGSDWRLQRSMDAGIDVSHALHIPTDGPGSNGSRIATAPRSGIGKTTWDKQTRKETWRSSRTTPSSRESRIRERDSSQLRWPDFGAMEPWRRDGSSPTRSICRTSASAPVSNSIKTICKL